MEENMKIFDFTLSEVDMDTIRELNIHDKGSRSFTDTEYARRTIGQVF